MLRDIDHFEARLGGLDGFEDAGEYLRNIAKAKEVVVPEPPAPPAAPAAEAPAVPDKSKDEEKEETGAAKPQPETEKQQSEPAKESNGDAAETKASEEVAAEAG
jgi:vacuolar protein sorting-associated protein 54